MAGKVYYEVTMTDEGLCRVGWSTRDGKVSVLVALYLGIFRVANWCCIPGSLELGFDLLGFGFGGTGKKSSGKKFEDYGEPFGLNDVIGCLLDRDANTIGFRFVPVVTPGRYRHPVYSL
jgi:ATP-dependent RNA helicase DDX1